MTVKELMEILAKQNPDALISLDVSCDNGYNSACVMESIEVETYYTYYSKTLKSDVVTLVGGDE